MDCNIEELVGKTLQLVHKNEESTVIEFKSIDGITYRMYHEQDCCESCEVESIVGDLADLIGSPVLVAEEISNKDEPAPEDVYESHTWTFYKIDTAKGGVTIRWLGMSNGYYSESVDFEKVLQG